MRKHDNGVAACWPHCDHSSRVFRTARFVKINLESVHQQIDFLRKNIIKSACCQDVSQHLDTAQAILIMAPCRLGCGFAASAGGIKCRFSGNKGRYSFDSIGSGEKSFSRKSKMRIAVSPYSSSHYGPGCGFAALSGGTKSRFCGNNGLFSSVQAAQVGK
ncbi:MAG: hypothetical protein LBP38_04430, partial [Desulfovibrio sp.]|nr:hypothetical protein [Desulfovibrio sp.]